MFKKRFSLPTLIISLILAILFTFQITFVNLQQAYDERLSALTLSQSDEGAKLQTVAEMLRAYCIYDIDPDLPTDMALTAYLAYCGDPYAAYYTPEAYQALLSADNGNQSGIGITVADDEKGLTILTVIPGSPAETAGLLASDRIITINGTAISSLDYSEKYNLLVGKVGQALKLTVLRGEETLSFDIVRATYESPSVIGSLLKEQKIGIVHILSFNNNTVKEFKELTASLVKQGATAFVYDLRGNPGGSLDAVVEVLDYLLPKGTIVTLEDYAGSKDVYTSDDKCFDYPAAILVNGTTASAAELFSACMRDYGAAFLVGETTYGKGVAQSFLSLPDGSVIKITTHKYYSPKTKNYDGKGLSPDFVVKTPENLTDFAHSVYESDPQMQKAVQELLKK